MTTLIEHMESYLGPIAQGWSADLEGNRLPFQIVEFSGGPFSGVRTLSTLGLSQRDLDVGETGQTLRHEFVMLFAERFGAGNLPAVLQQVGMECLARGRTYLRGDVIGPRGTLVEGLDFVSLYVAKPIYFPDEFAVYRRGQKGLSVSFIWLFPITASETELISRHGWEFFEKRLEAVDPDLTDLHRASIDG